MNSEPSNPYQPPGLHEPIAHGDLVDHGSPPTDPALESSDRVEWYEWLGWVLMLVGGFGLALSLNEPDRWSLKWRMSAMDGFDLTMLAAIALGSVCTLVGYFRYKSTRQPDA